MAVTELKPSVDEIVEALRADAGELDFNPQEARLFIQALRLLAEGRPISPEQVEQIAANLHLSGDEANATLNWISERNEDGHIVGMAGLSLNNWSHRFTVNDYAFSTWCALDTLYLPQMLRQSAEVESVDPVTQETVRLTIGPDKVESVSPASAIISIVVPQTAKKGLESAEEIWSAFCNYSHYFISVDTAQEWFDGKHIDPIILSIEEGHQLGRKWFEKVRKYA